MPTKCSFPLFLCLWNKMQNQDTPQIHLKIARWLETIHETKRARALLMAFRSCGKSTIIGLFCVWLLWRSPDKRILVLSADLALAKKMVRNVKRIIERHPLTNGLIPKNIDQWGSDRFTVKRDMELRDPSMLAKGISANLTGTRADIIICDDVEVPKTCDTPEKRELLRQRLHELDYILTPDGMQLYVGTPHCWNTIYADAARIDLGEEYPFLDGFSRLVLPILKEDGSSVWGERFPMDVIDAIKRKTGPMQFKSQMMCEPANIADGVLNHDNIVFYNSEIEEREAHGKWVMRINGNEIKGCSAWWDPAFGRVGGDRSILTIVFSDDEGRYYLHHLEQIIVNEHSETDAANQQCEMVAKIIAQYSVNNLAIETNGLGKFLPGILRKTLAVNNVSCAVKEITSRRPKHLRIMEAFDVVLAARALHVHVRVRKTPFLNELQEWRPNAGKGHDDCLDAVAGAINLQPIRIKKNNANNKSHQAKTIFEV